MALFIVLSVLLPYTFRPYCLPFSVRVISINAKCGSGLSCVVPVVPIRVLGLLVSRLETKVVSLIVRNCRFSELPVAR